MTIARDHELDFWNYEIQDQPRSFKRIQKHGGSPRIIQDHSGFFRFIRDQIRSHRIIQYLVESRIRGSWQTNPEEDAGPFRIIQKYLGQNYSDARKRTRAILDKDSTQVL